MNIKDFKVGQEVCLFITETNYNYRYMKDDNGNVPIEKRIIHTTITNVGKKYITVEHGCGTKFDATDNFRQVTNYSPDYMLYTSVQAIYDQMEANRLYNILRDAVYYGGTNCTYTVEQMREVIRILNIEED